MVRLAAVLFICSSAYLVAADFEIAGANLSKDGTLGPKATRTSVDGDSMKLGGPGGMLWTKLAQPGSQLSDDGEFGICFTVNYTRMPDLSSDSDFLIGIHDKKKSTHIWRGDNSGGTVAWYHGDYDAASLWGTRIGASETYPAVLNEVVNFSVYYPAGSDLGTSTVTFADGGQKTQGSLPRLAFGDGISVWIAADTKQNQNPENYLVHSVQVGCPVHSQAAPTTTTTTTGRASTSTTPAATTTTTPAETTATTALNPCAVVVGPATPAPTPVPANPCAVAVVPTTAAPVVSANPCAPAVKLASDVSKEKGADAAILSRTAGTPSLSFVLCGAVIAAVSLGLVVRSLRRQVPRTTYHPLGQPMTPQAGRTADQEEANGDTFAVEALLP